MTTRIRSFGASAGVSEISADAVAEALEAGDVLVFPEHPFTLSAQTLPVIAAAVAKAKNVSFDVNTGRLKGVKATDAVHAVLRDAMSSFAEFSRQTVVRLLPHYEGSLVMGRTSFRPAEISGRRTSWRKDDTRLHVDSFPSTPVHGRRILRFFSNVNPDGKDRHWRVGEPLPRVAPRFLSRLHAPLPGAAALLEAMRLTKTRRSLYDHYMLQLHDAMKRDADFQAHTVQAEFRFPPGSSWLAYTDMVPHAAMSGQHAFEQTFYLPVERMHDASKSPQRVLESLLGCALA
ncbi:MAG TPA: Kdo hydroxylase family protein [Burkholderiales bacterium]|nr:Kdo hydroxylase family protein [Burkholderiales bacterium]